MSKPQQTAVTKMFRAACDMLAKEFCKQLVVSDDPDDAWWISYGTAFAFMAGEMFVDAEEMTLTIENGLDYDSFSKWYWQWHDYEGHGIRKPGRVNLRSWIMVARPQTLTEKS